MTAKKQKKLVKNGYSISETKTIIDKYIDESAERLQKKFRMAWKKQHAMSKKRSYV
ncbi:hypothetical protein HZA42_02355 [Candidatus Peregrinibacteria bacterium]|nr:hypothetical protein [Candidatus Peregrinibacteria bacterium]